GRRERIRPARMGPSKPTGVARVSRLIVASGLWLSVVSLAQSAPSGQSMPNARSFSAHAAEIQAALNKLQPTLSGRLPTLDGFVVVEQRSLEQYRRGFYQCTVHVDPYSNGSIVRVSAKITAWHENSPRSGYEVRQSNGRLESDVLDRLQESLAPK